MIRRILLLAPLLLCACDRAEPEPAVTLRAPPETTMIPVRPLPRIVARDSLPARIFYDLTRYDWYARGEPLRWEDRDWHPAGQPVTLRTESLRPVGEFGGVDVWAAALEDSVSLLYVPVSEGWWLPFEARDAS